jgi:hypothetical protein
MSKREIPKHVHSFHLTKVSTAAVTFYFRPDGTHSGWALATVNDDTHELVIQSDWGSWSNRWPAAGMATGADGRRCTLMEFIADRSEDYCDYLADKLTSREEREQFDSYKTVDHLRGLLLKNRLEQGRMLLDYYEGEEPEDIPDVGTSEPPRYGVEWRKVRCSYGRDEEWPLTKATARSLYDELDDIKHIDNVQDFVARYYEIDGYAWIAENIEFEGDLKYEPSPHYYQLLHGILPAVVRACEKVVREREANAPCLAPEEREERTEIRW